MIFFNGKDVESFVKISLEAGQSGGEIKEETAAQTGKIVLLNKCTVAK